MRLLFPSWGKRKPPISTIHPSRSLHTLSDVLWTSICALRESADTFPPLKSAVGGVIALCEIAERAKHSKSDACAIALRTKEILDVVADAVPDGSAIPPPLVWSIQRFTVLLNEIRCRMETITVTGRVSRVVHLNRNERILQGIRCQLDDAYRDFLAASALRLEVQHARLATEQAETHREMAKISAASDVIVPKLSRLLFYSRFIVFLAVP
ncbi:hypothetical protein C8R44DRAFT_31047 [Mycena epipterygia]|nr:hypothetical protein C8R44DRAFT_31047 [Mycena epipterygia]